MYIYKYIYIYIFIYIYIYIFGKLHVEYVFVYIIQVDNNTLVAIVGSPPRVVYIANSPQHRRPIMVCICIPTYVKCCCSLQGNSILLPWHRVLLRKPHVHYGSVRAL